MELGDRGTLPADEFCRTNVPTSTPAATSPARSCSPTRPRCTAAPPPCTRSGVPVEPVAYTGVAWCVFTRPEIAKAGISERQARMEGIRVG